MRRAKGWPEGYELGYELFGINGKMLGHGDPIRVKQGERVLFHVLNASATEIRSLALPGHVFRIVALDGNPVPTPAEVPVLWLGTAERISAIVEMKHPGVWVMGDLADDDRGHGMGIVVEYAGRTGKPEWVKPKPFLWDYTLFGKPPSAPADARRDYRNDCSSCTTPPLHGFNLWTINGEAFSMDAMKPMFQLHEGRRYRLKFRNASDDMHPLHLHRHSFELTRVAGKPTSGVIKDVVMLGGFQELEVDFVADNPGPNAVSLPSAAAHGFRLHGAVRLRVIVDPDRRIVSFCSGNERHDGSGTNLRLRLTATFRGATIGSTRMRNVPLLARPPIKGKGRHRGARAGSTRLPFCVTPRGVRGAEGERSAGQSLAR